MKLRPNFRRVISDTCSYCKSAVVSPNYEDSEFYCARGKNQKWIDRVFANDIPIKAVLVGEWTTCDNFERDS